MGETDGLLEKLFLQKTAPAPRRKRTVEDFLRSWEARTRAYRLFADRKERISEGYLPSDEPDYINDVAFGILKKSHKVLSANEVRDEHGQPHKRMGTISHIAMLYAGKYASPLSPKPSDDFAVRGIVKPKLGGRVIFWETTPELTRMPTYVRECIDELLHRKLIQPETDIYGQNEDVPVGTAEDISHNW